ncbi:MAG: glycosyltransferase, partial [bacterium]
IILMIILILYSIRHYYFTLNRTFSEQKVYYQDIIDSDLPKVSILIPMHNEEKVANQILNSLINIDYPLDKLEIIPINDHSTDKTKEILDFYASKYNFIKPIHIYDNKTKGKQNIINKVVDIATGDIIVIYDADYIVPKSQIKDIVKAFIDPEVGAVMGKVVPYNSNKNLLTLMLTMERAAGYQIDQQARYNLNLVPQYGGTTGAFRKDLFIKLGKFDPNILAEDTELTFKLFLNGYKVVYANRLESFEEVPEDWNIRARQLRRWSRGHNQVMLKYLFKLILSDKLNIHQKIDGVLLLFIYTVPFLTLLGFLVSLFLFFMGEMNIVNFYLFLLAVYGYNVFGNFAPFYQIAIANFLENNSDYLKILPLFFISFVFNLFYSSLGFIDALLDLITKREVKWDKTIRFTENTNIKENINNG